MCAESKTARKKKPKDNILELSGDLSLQTAKETKNLFAGAVAGGQDVILRFEDVASVDMSFIQLLCSAHRSVHDAGHKLAIEGERPEAFSRLIEESGLDVHVGCWFDDSVECPWIVKNK